MFIPHIAISKKVFLVNPNFRHILVESLCPFKLAILPPSYYYG